MTNKYIKLFLPDNPRNSCVMSFKDFYDELEDMELEDIYSFKVVEMTDEEIDRLPSFDGF
jgi:hypothetical protein